MASLVLDVAKFSVIITGFGVVFGYLGLANPLVMLPTCNADLLAAQQACVPAHAGQNVIAGDENRDAFSLFTDALVLMTNNPVGHLILPLPSLLLAFATMPDGSVNRAIVAFAGIFTSLFAMSLFWFAVQILRGIGIGVFQD